MNLSTNREISKVPNATQDILEEKLETAEERRKHTKEVLEKELEVAEERRKRTKEVMEAKLKSEVLQAQKETADKFLTQPLHLRIPDN